MSLIAVCTECGSEDVEGVAMATINDPIHFVEWANFGDPDECFCNECQDWTTFDYIEEEKHEEDDDPMDGDAASALSSAGMGTDEDYGG